MDAAQRRRRARTKAVWRVINPPTRLLAGTAHWWVLLETTGRRTGRVRHTPLAAGPRDGEGMWLLAAQGTHANYVTNLVADPQVRLRHRGRWHTGTATIHDIEPGIIAGFNAYARGALRLGIDPKLVRVDYPSAVS